MLGLFGDGATSRSEFHSAMNFAGIQKPPVIFLCVNNSWAVSTPLECQTAQDNFASKGDAYAVRNLRVDGNDPLAVYSVVRDAHRRAVIDGPTLIEAITWRMGYHTSSDNPDLYRQEQESALWSAWDPIPRMRQYLQLRDWWSSSEETEWQTQCGDDIQRAIDEASRMPLPSVASQFEDVFHAPTWTLTEQAERVLAEQPEAGD